jgi:hypothetical protein
LRTVYMCCPLGNKDYESDMEQLWQYQNYVLMCGAVPYHYIHVLCDSYIYSQMVRTMEDSIGQELLKCSDDVWVFGNENAEEARRTIELSKKLNKPVLYVSEDNLKNEALIRQNDDPLTKNDCIENSDEMNYENQIIVLNPLVLKNEHRNTDNSLWKAYNGFGCTYGARGQAVFATNLLTGEKTHWERSDFLGIVEPLRLLKWMKDNPVRDETALEIVSQAEREGSTRKSIEPNLDYPYLVGYYPGENGWERTMLIPTAENIASFIVSHGQTKDIQIANPLDQTFITTLGMYIDQCTDQDFLQHKLLPVLIPMQKGEVEPKLVQEYEEQDDCEAGLDDEQEENNEI